MKLIISMITYNRLEYSKQTLRSLFSTIEVPYYLIVVDNNSDDGTKEYLASLVDRGRINQAIFNDENYYPGKATNIGWKEGLEEYPQATHLMRLDNDMHFERGWDFRAEEYFKQIDRLGQLGLDFDGGENKIPQYYNNMGLVEFPGCVGGPNIIRREIYDSGARYDETPWEGSRSKLQEDSKFSRLVKNEGWLVGHMDTRLSWTFATKKNWKDYKDYYEKTMFDRGYDDEVKYIEGLK